MVPTGVSVPQLIGTNSNREAKHRLSIMQKDAFRTYLSFWPSLSIPQALPFHNKQGTPINYLRGFP